MLRFRAIIWFLAVIACFLANQLVEHKFIMILMLFLLILPIFSILYSFWIKRKLVISFTPANEYIKRGEAAIWYINFENTSSIQTLAVRMIIKADSLVLNQHQLKSTLLIAQRSKETVRLTTKPEHSGPFSINGLSISINDIFGFFTIKVYKSTMLDIPNIYVLPLTENTEGYDKFLRNQLESGEFPAGKNQVLLDEIDRFRDMMAGDSLKLIHWKLSARMQQWIVKEFDKEDDKSVTVLLNLPNFPNKYYIREEKKLYRIRDYMLDHAYSAIQIFLSVGATVRLKTYQPELMIEEAVNMNELELLRKQLAHIPAKSAISFSDQITDEFQGNEHNVIYVLTNELNSNFVTSLRALRTQTGAILLVYVSEETSLLSVESYIEQLQQADIKVEISNPNGGNHYAE